MHPAELISTSEIDFFPLWFWWKGLFVSGLSELGRAIHFRIIGMWSTFCGLNSILAKERRGYKYFETFNQQFLRRGQMKMGLN